MDFISVKLDSAEYSVVPNSTVSSLFRGANKQVPAGIKINGASATADTNLHSGDVVTVVEEITVSIMQLGCATITAQVTPGMTVEQMLKSLPNKSQYINADGTHKFEYTTVTAGAITKDTVLSASLVRIMLSTKVKGAKKARK